MIKLIIDMLELANGETDKIKIAQGKYYFPNSLKNAFKQIKKEIKWKSLK
tara:strand:+ start:769 stop:918 length:150 start_codon:yes stop_codon:yes gene_type:complete